MPSHDLPTSSHSPSLIVVSHEETTQWHGAQKAHRHSHTEKREGPVARQLEWECEKNHGDFTAQVELGTNNLECLANH